MVLSPLTKRQIEEAKEEQRRRIAECDKAVIDLKFNIDYLEDQVKVQVARRSEAVFWPT